MLTLKQFKDSLSSVAKVVMTDAKTQEKKELIDPHYEVIKQAIRECPTLTYNPTYRKIMSEVHQIYYI